MTRLRHPGLRLLAPLAFLALAGACSIHLVSDYDEQIDNGLTQLNTDVAVFVTKMIDVAGTPAGAYSYKKDDAYPNKEFYAIQEGKLDTLIVRAQAHKALDQCPSTAVIERAVTAAVPRSELARYSAQIPKDDCSVVLLQLVKDGIGDLRKLHEAQGSAGIPSVARDPILVGGVGALIRAAITVEVAKKTGAKTGG
jgi:hypothetical protein